jgi:polar amino acid transport system substrate-binding protein
MNFFKCLIIILIFNIFCAKAATKQLSVGWELWYPYQFHNSKQQLVGLDFDIFNAIVNQANLTVSYTELPWKRHLHYLKSGEMDVAMGASYSAERADYAYFTEAYRTEKVMLYVLKNQAKNIRLNTLKDLIDSPYKIGVEAGYFYGNQYQQLIKNKAFSQQINEVIDLEENITLLMAGKLHGILVDPITMKVFVEKYKLTNEFEPHQLTIYQDDIRIMLSKKTMSKENLLLFNKAIAVLKANGSLAKIRNRWADKQQLAANLY